MGFEGPVRDWLVGLSGTGRTVGRQDGQGGANILIPFTATAAETCQPLLLDEKNMEQACGKMQEQAKNNNKHV